ncbi:MAG TPA: hypothetical protein DD725_08380 [Deltaproteobacteria bacterium]|nr:hypothetical protein [Deltaproteobacteria bacterium]
MADRFSQKMHRVVSEVKEELEKIDALILELDRHRSVRPENSFYLRAVASILHDFYCGAERIFIRIAEELNGGIPEGENWHIQLLKDMGLEIEKVRPSVISHDASKRLREYLEFRHRFRNIYGFELEWEKMKGLRERLPVVAEEFKKEMKQFLKFMQGISKA